MQDSELRAAWTGIEDVLRGAGGFDPSETRDEHGQWTAGAVGGDAVLLGPGQRFDFHASGYRRFLFDAKSGRMVLGVGGADANDEGSHAQALLNATHRARVSRDYDAFGIRGFFSPQRNWIDATSGGTLYKGDLSERNRVRMFDEVTTFVQRMIQNGANADTMLRVYRPLPGWPSNRMKLGEAFPELFRAPRRRAAEDAVADAIVSALIADLEQGALLLADPTLEADFVVAQLGKTEAEVRLALGERSFFKLLGGAGSGNYGHAGRPGEVGGSAPDVSPDVMLAMHPVKFASMGTNRRFMYNPHKGALVLGATSDEPYEAHATIFEETKAPGAFDDYIRGFVDGENNNLILFSFDDLVDAGTFDDVGEARADYIDRQLQTVEFFIKSGASATTKVEIGFGLGDTTDKYGTIKSLFPELLGKRSRKMRGLAAAPAWHALHRAADAQLPAFQRAIRKAFKAGQAEVSIGQIEAMLRAQMRAMGGSGSGNFDHAGRPGEVGGSALSDETVILKHLDFAHLPLAQRRFMYSPEQGVFILGTTKNTGSVYGSTHGEDFDAVAAPGAYDDYVKGYVGAKQIDFYKFDDQDNVVSIDRRLQTIQFFVKSGAPLDTLVRGYGSIQEAFPELAKKTRGLAAWLRSLVGGPGSGNFGHAGRPGEVGGSAPGDAVGSEPTVIPSRQHFDFATLGQRFFLFNPATGALVLGTDTSRPYTSSEGTTHAEVLDAVRKVTPVAGTYDQFVKGFFTGAADDPYAPDVLWLSDTGQYLPGGKENPEAALADAFLTTMTRFINAGMPPTTKIGGVSQVFPQLSERYGLPASEIFPELFKSKKGRAAVANLTALDPALAAIDAALEPVLRVHLLQALGVSGALTAGMVPRWRGAAGFDPGEARDEHGQWTGSGSSTEVVSHEPQQLADAMLKAVGRIYPRSTSLVLGTPQQLVNATLEQRGAVKAEIVGDLSKRIASQIGPTQDAQAFEVFTQRTVDQWANSSGDHDPDSVRMQLAVDKVFDLKDASLSHMQATIDQARAPDQRDTAYVKAEYEATQAFFKAAGITHVSVYRGTGGEHEAPAGGKTTVQLQPASSWTSDASVAIGFAADAASGRGVESNGTVLTARVPVERVLSTAVTGRGCLSEAEVILLGGLLEVNAVPRGADEQEAYGHGVTRPSISSWKQKIHATFFR